MMSIERVLSFLEEQLCFIDITAKDLHYELSPLVSAPNTRPTLKELEEKRKIYLMIKQVIEEKL